MLELILIAVIIIQSVIHFFERRDMYNRIMSKSFTEYKQGDKKPPKHIPSAHELTLRKWRNKAGDE
jgi:hypothetical protein